jgi:hypothetical protein
LRPCLELIAPDNVRTVACSNAFAQRIDLTLDQTGTYTVLISAFSFSGAYALALQCLGGPCVVAPGSLVIFPLSGTLATTFGFDLGLIVDTPGRSVGGGTATLNGTDVTAALMRCVIPGSLPTGGGTFRCPARGRMSSRSPWS